MDDSQIIELYWQRSQAAITETSEKYARYCLAISLGILSDEADAQVCQRYPSTGSEAISPNRPECLKPIWEKSHETLPSIG